MRIWELGRTKLGKTFLKSGDTHSCLIVSRNKKTAKKLASALNLTGPSWCDERMSYCVKYVPKKEIPEVKLR